MLQGLLAGESEEVVREGGDEGCWWERVWEKGRLSVGASRRAEALRLSPILLAVFYACGTARVVMVVQDLLGGIWNTERIKKTESRLRKRKRRRDQKSIAARYIRARLSSENPLKLLSEVAGVGASRRDAGSGFCLVNIRMWPGRFVSSL
jgi:hypothetical protein